MELQSDFIVPGVRMPQWDYEIHLSRYTVAAKFVANKEILDIGCGVGYGASYLMRKGPKKITAGDISDKALEIAKKTYAKPGLDFLHLDGSNLPFADNSFDVIISMGMFDHLVDHKNFLFECRRVLRIDGYFLCSIMNRQFITPSFFKKPLDPYHNKEFTHNEFMELSGQYFTNLEVYGLVHGGKFWWGFWSIARNIIRELHFPVELARKLAQPFSSAKYAPIIYSEDKVDGDFENSSLWKPLTLDMDSQAVSFLVVCKKE